MGNPLDGEARQFRLRVETVPDQGSRVVRFLGPWKSCAVHWNPRARPKGRTEPCNGAACDKDRHKLTKEWRAFAPMEWFDSEGSGLWVPAILEITDSLGNFLRERRLLGEVWELFRQKSDGQHFECAGRFVQVDRPPMIDTRLWVEAVCYRLWRTDAVEWGVEPWLPCAVAFEGRTAPPPPNLNPRTIREQPMSGSSVRKMLAEARAKLKTEEGAKK